MKHTISLFFYVIGIVMLYISCSHKDCEKTAILCKCFVFDMRNHDYNNCLIEVSKDSILTAYIGETSPQVYNIIDNNFNVTSIRNPFLRKIKYKMTHHIKKSEFIKLTHAIDNIQHLANENIPKFNYMTDTWKCIIVTGGNQYGFDDLTDKHEAFKKLLGVIDSLSPVRLYYRDSYPIYY